MRTYAALLALTLLTAGCGTAATPAAPAPATSATNPPRPHPAAASGGCRAGRDARLTSGAHELTFAGITRRYLLAVPQGPGPHPVVLNLHGLGSDAAQQAAYSRLPEAGARRGYLVATPQSAPGRLAWTLPHTGGPDDTAYLAALLDHLQRHQCVRPGREFAAGMSYGAGMAVSLVCALHGRLSAVAAVAGIPIAQPCEHPVPTTIVAFHGTADRLVPYRGGHPEASGSLKNLAGLVVLPPVEQTMDRWAAALGCTRPAVTHPRQDIAVRVWKSCPRGTTLRLYAVNGGGHTWPGPIEVPGLGPTARDLNATELILDTFDRAPTR